MISEATSKLRTAVCTLALGSTFVAPSAWACGGFFCESSSPVNQAAERIIFAQDSDGNVTQIVEVLYEGDAESFSWVLPVPGTPTPGVSSVQAFDRLQNATNPNYQLQSVGGCNRSVAESASAGGDGDINTGGGPQVTVVDSGQVGPFDYETISVDAADEDPADVAVRWLEDNGYDVGPMGREVLGPYLVNGLNLIAFRLQKGRSAGAIRPISLEYKANAMAIPIRPTAVAANADMPILVWVLGEERAVSTNYRGLELNELLIDWFNPGDSYNQVVIAAANEAGGQGFVTELAEDAARFANMIAFAGERQLLEFASVDSGVERVLVDLTEQLGGHDGFMEVVEDHVPLRGSITAQQFVECPYCYFYPGESWIDGYGGAGGLSENGRISDTDPIFETDLGVFIDAVDENVLAPIQETADLFTEHDYVTRLYTTMSAAEMTRDPIFEFNPDLGDVSNIHTAEVERDCDDRFVVTLPDGQRVYGQGRDWPHSLSDTDMPTNVRILQYSTSGEGEVIFDNSATIQSIHNNSPAGTAALKKGGGFCAYEEKSPSRFSWLYLLPGAFAGVWMARRRRI